MTNMLSLFEEYPLDELYVCGGCIRDHILTGRVSNDIDLFVNCTRKEFDDLLTYLRNYGEIQYGQYGSPRFYPTGESIHYIDIVPFYNFIVARKSISTVTELLENFDITANAIGYHIKTKRFYDPLGGVADIRAHLLKAVRLDFPEKRVSPVIPLSTVSVFWFRLLHYHNKLQFTFDRTTFDWIVDNCWRIKDRELFESYFYPVVIAPDILEILEKRIDVY